MIKLNCRCQVTSIAYRKGHEFDLRIAWQWVQLESYGELNQAIIFHVSESKIHFQRSLSGGHNQLGLRLSSFWGGY